VPRYEQVEGRIDRLAAARILYRYRRLILLGRLEVTHDAAQRLVGPDCAYHLYGRGNVKRRRARQGPR
jgi:hypothetical protein